MHITNHVNLYSKTLCHFKNNKIVAVSGTTTAVPATAAFCTTAAAEIEVWPRETRVGRRLQFLTRFT